MIIILLIAAAVSFVASHEYNDAVIILLVGAVMHRGRPRIQG